MAFPTEDGKALTYMQTMAAGIASDPGKYQLQNADAVNISNAVDGFAAAYGDSQDPAQRTPLAIALKDEMRNTAEQLCRQYAILIKYNAGISDADKMAIGIPPPNNSRQPINVPSSMPVLNVVGATPGSQTVRYIDNGTNEKAKPFGAASIQLFVAIADGPVADPAEADFYGAFTKNPIGVAFDAADNGKTATYFARWASRRGDTGSWSLPVALTIAA